jgi:hypothetical protein
LSGAIAGDLFVFGDIRDVVREGKHVVMARTATALFSASPPRGSR